MRLVLSLGAAVILTACSMSSTPPGGSCVSRASADLNALNGAITSAETNLARGYGIERQAVENSSQIESVQVPINAAKERHKLAGLQTRLPGVQAQTDTALALCGA